jgi:hypothetical protein
MLTRKFTALKSHARKEENGTAVYYWGNVN